MNHRRRCALDRGIIFASTPVVLDRNRTAPPARGDARVTVAAVPSQPAQGRSAGWRSLLELVGRRPRGRVTGLRSSPPGARVKRMPVAAVCIPVRSTGPERSAHLLSALHSRPEAVVDSPLLA